VLGTLAQLVRADIVVFNDLGPRRRVEWAGSDSEGDITGYCAQEDEDPWFDIFWSSPCSYPDRSGDLESPTLLSDFYTHGRMRTAAGNGPWRGQLRIR
jgi:ABC-type cobalt transport system substrate-binding protein